MHFHLQQQNERMCRRIGTNVEEAVHQQNTDKVPHWLLFRLTADCVVALACRFRLNLKYVNKKIRWQVIIVRALEVQKGGKPLNDLQGRLQKPVHGGILAMPTVGLWVWGCGVGKRTASYLLGAESPMMHRCLRCVLLQEWAVKTTTKK